MLDQDIRFRVR